MNAVRILVASAMLLFLGTGLALAQSKTMSAQERANLKTALDFWREILQAGHAERANKYLTEEYIQHNPNVSTGRAAFVKFFSAFPARPISATLQPAPTVQFAKGPYVVLIWDHDGKDPKDGSPYKYDTFDLFRFENGRIAEHWDHPWRGVPYMPAPTGDVQPGIGPKPMSPPNTPSEQAVQDIATHLYKDVLMYGHTELAESVMAAGYIQHNPNVATGREGFLRAFSGRPSRPIQPEWPFPPELIITSGNLVFYMFPRFAADPRDPSQVYKWTWFDLFRVENGLVQEHWDSAMKVQAPMPMPKPAAFQEYK